MTDDASPENLRKFLESDDPALVGMGISMARGLGMEVTIKDLDHFLKSGDLETVKTGLMLADEAGIGDEVIKALCGGLRADLPSFFACGTVDGLRHLNDARAVGPLIKILAEGGGCARGRPGPNRGSAPCVARVLGEIGDARAVDPLIKALNYDGYCIEGFSVAEASAKALKKLGHEVE
jgi:HEAT repeat protein